MASIAQFRPPAAAPHGAAGAHAPLASNDALVLSHVTQQFGALRAVDEVSLAVAAGQKYAILGSNGAGKTTLFNAITGDFPATAGRIRFFGEDITELPPHERIRKGLRRTYQSSLLFRELSVRDNLFLAVRGVSSGRFAFLRARAGHASTVATQDLLERARLSHLADEFSRIAVLRRALVGVPPVEAMELLLTKLKKTPNNIMNRSRIFPPMECRFTWWMWVTNK